MNHFKGKQFQQDVIIVAVGYYLRYNLSYREVQEIAPKLRRDCRERADGAEELLNGQATHG